uniref:hypothetical protein n=1 Tax=Bradyrhizobium sp. (strain ORS 278) TaxID=114615 RepID=UPI0012FEE25C|nr:hypothetical protein [Bradyrhizobium sp. ORS 278]
MYLMIWFLLGVFFAWIIAEGRAVAWDYFFADASIATPRWWALAIIVVVLLGIFAVVSDNAAMPQTLLALRSVFIGPRFECFILGGLIGTLAHYNKDGLADVLRRLTAATLGEEQNTAWAFQAAIAILGIAAIVFAARPDFFDYLRSFKVGGFEATFAERTNNTIRDTDYHLRDQRDLFSVEQYAYYEPEFIDPASPRGRARRMFTRSALIDETDVISVMLVSRYLWPAMGAISCYQSAHQIDLTSHDPAVAAFLYSWQQLLLSIRTGEIWGDDESTKGTDVFKQILTRIRMSEDRIVRSAAMLKRGCLDDLDNKKSSAGNVPSNAPRAVCQPGSNITFKEILSKSLSEATPAERDAGDQEVAHDIECLQKRFKAARAILKETNQDSAQVAAVIIVDSYLTTAIGDLTLLVSGQQKEAANFLTNMLDDFPKAEEFVTPGVISAFYVMSEAKIETLALWPIEPTLSEINYSVKGVDMMLSRSARCLEKSEDPRGHQLPECDLILSRVDQQTSTDGKRKPPRTYCNEERSKLWCDIYEIYLKNSLIVMSTKIKYFNEVELSGRSMSEASRQEWAASLGKMIALLRARLETVISSPDNIPAHDLDERQKRWLPNLNLTEQPDVLFEAEQATALSLNLFDGRGARPSAQSCNLSLFLLNDAQALPGKIQKALGLGTAQAMRWQQLLNVVAQRVAANCSWIDRRGQDGAKDVSIKDPGKAPSK